MVWTVTTAVIVVVGVLLVTLTVLDRQNNAEAAPIIGDHWHAFLGADACGTWLPNASEFEVRATEAGVKAGLHSHGDGLMHIHPFSTDEAGTKATVGRFVSYDGRDVSETSFKLWDAKQYKNGDKCATGADKGKVGEVQWTVGRFGEPWKGTPRTGNPADYHAKNGDIVAVYFLPKGSKLPEPPDAESALANIEDLGGAPASGTGTTVSTVAGDTTTSSTPATGDTSTTTAP